MNVDNAVIKFKGFDLDEIYCSESDYLLNDSIHENFEILQNNAFGSSLQFESNIEHIFDEVNDPFHFLKKPRATPVTSDGISSILCLKRDSNDINERTTVDQQQNEAPCENDKNLHNDSNQLQIQNYQDDLNEKGKKDLKISNGKRTKSRIRLDDSSHAHDTFKRWGKDKDFLMFQALFKACDEHGFKLSDFYGHKQCEIIRSVLLQIKKEFNWKENMASMIDRIKRCSSRPKISFRDGRHLSKL